MSKVSIKSQVKHKGKVVRLLSGSSVDQRHEPMNKNVIGGMCNGMSGPRIASERSDETGLRLAKNRTKSSGQVACVNGAVVCRSVNNLSGEASASGDVA